MPSQPEISSPRNPRIIEVAKLHGRRQRRSTGLTLVEGPHLVADAVAAGADIVELFAIADSPVIQASAPVTLVSPEALRRLAGTAHPRGPVAVVRIPETVPLASTPTVVLWEVGDPGNVGAILRSAAAFGFAVAVVEGSADPWAPKTIRAGAAAQFHTAVVPLRPGEAVDRLVAAGLELWVAVATGGVAPEEIDGGPGALLIGSETHGLPPEVVARADRRITISMAGAVDSLNAAVAAGILLYVLGRRTGRPAPP